MAQVLSEQSKPHFGQSKGCTLTSHLIDFTMAFTATCSHAKAILEGTFFQPSRSQTTPQTSTAFRFKENPNLSGQGNDHTWPTSDMDENDTVDPPCHQPLHLQRSIIPELAQKLLDSLQYVTSPDVDVTEEEYKGKLKS